MIDVSTNWPSPVRSRWYSACTMAMADRNPLPVSPSDTTGQNGMPPWSRPPSSQSGPASAAPVWSLPGRCSRAPVLEAAGVAVDEIGLDRAQALVVDAEAYRGVVAHVVLHDVGRRTSSCRIVIASGSLRFMAMLRLPRLQHIAMCVLIQ